MISVLLLTRRFHAAKTLKGLPKLKSEPHGQKIRHFDEYFNTRRPLVANLELQHPHERRKRVEPVSLLKPADWMKTLGIYSQLAKSRLATLVVLTTVAGYAMAPMTCNASPTLLMYTSLGTALCVASANAINQIMEIPHDARMTRTRTRPLVLNKITKQHALGFGIGSGVVGSSLLWVAAGPVPGILGLSNILLYTMVYTPMKRRSVYNTWVGSVVGAIPPLIGWAATSPLDSGALLLGLVLYSWQFPHFMSLSYTLRKEYQHAGYKMLSFTDEQKNANVSLRHSLALIPMCAALSYTGVTTEAFALTSLAPNLWMAYWAYRFYHKQEREKNAKQLFYASLFHLPAIVLLMLIHKKKWEKKKEI